MLTLNERAHELANAIVADAVSLGVAVHTLACGARVIDCGVAAPGSIEAGRRLAEVCLSGLGSVAIIKGTGLTLREMEDWHPIPFSELDLAFATVIVMSERPVAACLASQYAGWEIKDDTFFAMASGPMRAAAGREELFDVIGYREQSEVCVGVLEASKLPPDRVCQDLAEKCHIAPERLTILVARTCSIVGTVQIVARSLETALHKLHVLGFDLNRIASGFGTAPLPPIADSDLTALGRTNDAILYGSY
ncbi:MAG: methenyltetrahydromethanopterin cyclohydrolase, partial [Pirellulales bacterium]